jgi:hypothetical protein
MSSPLLMLVPLRIQAQLPVGLKPHHGFVGIRSQRHSRIRYGVYFPALVGDGRSLAGFQYPRRIRFAAGSDYRE